MSVYGTRACNNPRRLSPAPEEKSLRKTFFSKTNLDQFFLQLEYVCFVEIMDAEKMNTFLQEAKVPVIVGK